MESTRSETRLNPHPIPYQGSKRRLAPEILRFGPQRFARFFEPFAGSAALTLAVAREHPGAQLAIGDCYAPLAELWRSIVFAPQRLVQSYRHMWLEQRESPREYYEQARARFNREPDAATLLYLLSRCVKSAVRFNRRGEFNQSADHRRLGARPSLMRARVFGAAFLLRGRCQVRAADYAELLAEASRNDFVYLDPPYEGVSSGGDARYAQQLARDRLIEELERLNSRAVPYLLSFDGRCGEREYGEPLPTELRLGRIFLAAGRSSQATLNGRSAETVESLYLSPCLRKTHSTLAS